MAHRPPRRERRWPRIGDLGALCGLAFFAVQLAVYFATDRFSGQFVWASVSLVLGSPVQRVSEALLSGHNEDR